MAVMCLSAVCSINLLECACLLCKMVKRAAKFRTAIKIVSTVLEFDFPNLNEMAHIILQSRIILLECRLLDLVRY